MKLRALALALVLTNGWLLAAAEVGIELAGVLGGDSDVRVALKKTGAGATRWVAVGGSFEGYKVASYDAKTEVVTLTKDGQSHRLQLKSGKVGSAPAPELKAPPQIERAVLNNLRQLTAAADQFYLENGKSTVTYDEIVGPTKYVKQLNTADGENYRSLVFKQGQTLTVKTSTGYSVSYAP